MNDAQTPTGSIDSLRQELKALELRAREGECPESLDTSFQQMHGALEELYVLQEELAEKNSMLSLRNADIERECERCRTLYQFAPDAFFATDIHGKISEVNAAACTMLGKDENFLMGKPMAVYFTPPGKAGFFTTISNLEEGTATEFLSEMVSAGGAAVPVRIKAKKVSWRADDGAEMLWLLHDVSDMRRAQARIEGGRADLESYTRTISHDLRGPIAAIALASGILAETSKHIESPEVRAELDETGRAIESNTRTAFMLIDGLLEAAEMAAPETRLGEVDVSDVVKRVVHERQFEIKAKHATISVDDDMGKMRARPVHVFQLFSNLISNVLQYDDHPSPTARITFEGKDPRGRNCYMVSDNGPGFQEEVIENAGGGELEQWGFGPGMGLSIVRDIVRMYGGDIEIHNQDGARVLVCLGEYVEAMGETVKSREADAERPNYFLLVEDEEGTAYMVKSLVTRRIGADVDIAFNLEEARARLSEATYSAVLLDYKLPDGTGLDLLEEMADQPESPPVILVTGHGDETTAARAIALGACGYVLKDEEIATNLPNVIRRVLPQ